MTQRGAPGAIDWLVLIAMTASWGSAFAALRIAVAEIHPTWNTVLRLAFATVALGVALMVSGQRLPRLTPRPEAAWGFYTLSGVVGMALPFLLFAYASTTLPSAVTAICNGATPVFVAVLAHFAVGERLTPRRALGVALGFAGLVVLVGGGAVRDAGDASLAALGAALAGAAAYAVSGVSVRRAPEVRALPGALMVCLTGLIAAVPVALAMGAPLPTGAVSVRAWAAAVFLGLLPTAAAMIGWVWLTHRRGALFASMGTYVAPLFAAALGVLWLGERLQLEAVAALALVVGGMLVAGGERRDRPDGDGPETPVAEPLKDR